MKSLLIISFFIISQLSFSSTSAEIAICSMSSDEITNLETQLKESKNELKTLDVTNNVHIGATTANLLAVAYMFKGKSNLSYTPFLIYGALTTGVGISNYIMNRNDIAIAKEIIPVLEEQIARAKELNISQDCDEFIENTESEIEQIRVLKLAISNLSKLQNELNSALDAQTVSATIKVSSFVAIISGFVVAANVLNKKWIPLVAVLIGGGVIGNLVGENIGFFSTLMDRGDVEELSVKIDEQLEIMSESLKSLQQLQALKAKYMELN